MKIPDSTSILERARGVFYRKLGGYDFHRMQLYLRDMKGLMAYKKGLLKESHKEELKLYPGAAWLIDDVYAKDYANYDRHFLGILHNSTFLSAYSLFEARFKDLCMFAARKRRISIVDDEFYGDNSVRRCQNFLKTNFRLKMKAVKPYLVVLDRHTELRNRIAHHQATIPVPNEALTNFVRKNKHIRLRRLRGKKNRPFEIKDHLYVHYFLKLTEDQLLWLLMRVLATKNERDLLDKEDDKEIILFQNRRAHTEAQRRVLGHFRKARIRKPKAK
jgi:hypothetical protein